MTHPHSDQRSFPVYQRPAAFSPYPHLVNAPVSRLDPHTSVFIPEQQSTELPSVVDGEVITNHLTTSVDEWVDSDLALLAEPKRSMLRRAIEDPYWILMTLMVVLGFSTTATVVYGVIQITLAIGQWLHAHGATLGAITVLIVALMLCGGTSAAKCAGIHCGGCNR